MASSSRLAAYIASKDAAPSTSRFENLGSVLSGQPINAQQGMQAAMERGRLQRAERDQRQVAKLVAVEPSDGADRDSVPDDQHDEEEIEKEEQRRKENEAEDLRAEATQAATKRFSTVMASTHYAGREALAQNLLSQPNMSTQAILTALVASPKPGANSGAGRGPSRSNGGMTHMPRKEASDLWDRAYASLGISLRQSAAQPAGNNASDLWDRAYAELNVSQQTASKSASASEPQDSWDRVYGDLHHQAGA